MKLRTSPNFALAVSTGGDAYVIREVEPYTQFWLSDTERLLFALFAAHDGMRECDAVETLVRLVPGNPDAQRAEAVKAIAEMRGAGVLLAPTDDLSRYDRSIARHYREHRPFPRAVAARIGELAKIAQGTPVLDLASGPGSLAIELAMQGAQVTIMELSAAFIRIAQDEATRRGLTLSALHESCNRLSQHDGAYQAVTISQAIHWLDMAALVRGVCRTLTTDGQFFVVQGALSLPNSHPLAYILGDRTPLGDKAPGPFAAQVQPLARRLDHLFAGLDPQAGARQAIAFAGIELFRQERPIDEGFARAFLSDAHIAGLGMTRDHFWRDLAGRCAGVPADRFLGVQEWALIHFARGAERGDPNVPKPGPTTAIAYP